MRSWHESCVGMTGDPGRRTRAKHCVACLRLASCSATGWVVLRQAGAPRAAGASARPPPPITTRGGCRRIRRDRALPQQAWTPASSRTRIAPSCRVTPGSGHDASKGPSSPSGRQSSTGPCGSRPAPKDTVQRFVGLIAASEARPRTPTHTRTVPPRAQLPSTNHCRRGSLPA